MIVAFSGTAGAGNTTVGSLLEEMLPDYKLMKIGELYKQKAEEKGFKRKNLDKFWETEEGQNKKFHNELDEMQKKIAKEEKKVIFDGKLSAFNLPDADLKIFITAPLGIRAKRIAQRENMAFDDATKHIIEKEKHEQDTWGKIYNFDYAKQLDNYDVVLNTEKWNAESVAEIIKTMIKRMER